MSSPRKYSSPYLSGLPGLPTAASSTTVKPKKKSKNTATKLSDSAAAVKQIQDGIWQNAKGVRASRTTIAGDHHVSPRQEVSYDDASSFGGIAVEKFLDEIKETSGNEQADLDVDNVEGSQNETVTKVEEEEDDGSASMHEGASALVAGKDSIPLKQSSLNGDNQDVGTKEKNSSEENKDDTVASQDFPEDQSPAALKSILKKSSFYPEKQKKEPSSSSKNKPGKTISKGKYGRPVKEPRDNQGLSAGRVMNKLKGTQGSISNLEVYNKFSNNSKAMSKSPRKKSKVGGVLGNEQDTRPQPAVATQGPRKSVRFSNKVDVHVVPYEPRAGSRACDWQRNMIEQRVNSITQFLRDVGDPEEMDIFGNPLLFPGYPSYHVPNPNFALRGAHAGPGFGAGLLGIPGMGRARNHFKM